MSTNGSHQSAGCPSILTNEGVWAHPAEEGVSCAAPWPAREARGLAGPGYDPRRGDHGQGGPGHLPRHSVPWWLCGGPGFPVCLLLFQASAFPPGGSAPPPRGVANFLCRGPGHGDSAGRLSGLLGELGTAPSSLRLSALANGQPPTARRRLGHQHVR